MTFRISQKFAKEYITKAGSSYLLSSCVIHTPYGSPYEAIHTRFSLWSFPPPEKTWRPGRMDSTACHAKPDKFHPKHNSATKLRQEPTWTGFLAIINRSKFVIDRSWKKVGIQRSFFSIAIALKLCVCASPGVSSIFVTFARSQNWKTTIESLPLSMNGWLQTLIAQLWRGIRFSTSLGLDLWTKSGFLGVDNLSLDVLSWFCGAMEFIGLRVASGRICSLRPLSFLWWGKSPKWKSCVNRLRMTHKVQEWHKVY